MTHVEVSYYTDPACPWSWALEPTLRKLIIEFGESLDIDYVMCGMAREFGDAEHLVGDGLEAADSSGMPVDVRLWLNGAPRSSFPACIAVKAAAEQGSPDAYLRRLREGFQCRRRKLDSTDALVQAARESPGLDLGRFEIALSSHGTLEAFGGDIERCKQGEDRLTLPSLRFGEELVVGFTSYEELREVAMRAGARPTDAPAPSIEQAMRRFGTMATAEVAAVCELPGPRAPAELWRLASEWRVKPERLGTGELWSLAPGA